VQHHDDPEAAKNGRSCLADLDLAISTRRNARPSKLGQAQVT
jgi:hypothetical protein